MRKHKPGHVAFCDLQDGGAAIALKKENTTMRRLLKRAVRALRVPFRDGVAFGQEVEKIERAYSRLARRK